MSENVKKILKNNLLNKVKIFCPYNRIDNYYIYCQKIFCFKNIEFIRSLENLSDNDLLILDQSFLNIFLKKDRVYKKKNIRLIILFWNGDLDYFLYENQVKRLKKNFRLYCFTLSNFYKIQNLYFLNNFKIQEKIKKMNVSGLNF